MKNDLILIGILKPFDGTVLVLKILFLFAVHFKSSSSTTSRELREQFAACSG